MFQPQKDQTAEYFWRACDFSGMRSRSWTHNLAVLLALLCGIAVFQIRQRPHQAAPLNRLETEEQLRRELERQVSEVFKSYPEVLDLRVRVSRIYRCCFCDEETLRAMEQRLYFGRVLLKLRPGYTPPKWRVEAWLNTLVTLGEEVELKPENCTIVDTTGRDLTRRR